MLDREILEFIRLRAKLQHNAYCRRLGTDPCMDMFTRGECHSKQDCQYQHIRPEKMTVGWFNHRVRSVLTEIRTLNWAGFHPTGVIVFALPFTIITPYYDFVRTGIGFVSFTIFRTLRRRSSGPSRYSISGTHLNQQSGSGRRVSGFCLAPQFRPPLSPWFMPICTMACDFDYERAQGYIPRTRMYRWEKWPRCLTRPGSEMRRNFIVRDFVQFSKGGPHHSLILGTLYLRWVSHSCVRSSRSLG